MAATALAACHSSATATANLPSKGGTLNVILSNQPINNLDPQEISLANDSDISHLLDRTLTTVNAAGQVVPDLATDTGRPSQDLKTWEFTLKSGLRWQDGTPVRCQDVQYGIERRFNKTINAANGLNYPLTYLVDNQTPYKGPFGNVGVSADKTLSSIVCIDQNTIQFHLTQPYGDFGYTVSVSTFAPMKYGGNADNDYSADGSKTSTNYDPFSDGPYEVDYKKSVIQLDPSSGFHYASHLELVRNPYWSRATDSVRKAYPDRIVFDYDASKPKVTNALIQSGTPYYQNAINLDSDVSSQFVQQVINDPALSKRAVAGFEGATRYFAINTIKMSKLGCRQALEYGFDKFAWRFEAGGAVFGQLATSMIPPNLLAHANFDIYDTTGKPDGNATEAAKLWKQNNCPSSVKIAFPNASGLPQQMSTVVRAYQNANIRVVLDPLPQQTYFDQLISPRSDFDMSLVGWVPDWANGSAVIPPLFGGQPVAYALKHNQPVGNSNFSYIDNPSLDTAISDAFKQSDLATQYKLWGQLDHTVMAQAYAIPILFTRGLRMTGTNVRGAVMSAAYGEPDLSSIGVVS
ncbi:MAG TPA: ABC transporter substrate-binding protein [Micromonosporaceae bacterium]